MFFNSLADADVVSSEQVELVVIGILPWTGHRLCISVSIVVAIAIKLGSRAIASFPWLAVSGLPLADRHQVGDLQDMRTGNGNTCNNENQGQGGQYKAERHVTNLGRDDAHALLKSMRTLLGLADAFSL